jgi:NADH:ubiquinone oxidoreductase subunit 6 (subunit J)
MRIIFASITTLIWALWFGGIMALFLFVQSMFNVRHDIAGEANIVLFEAFERYQMLLAAGGLIMTFLWYLSFRNRKPIIVFVLLAVAAIAGVVSTVYITPKIVQAQLDNTTKTPEFRKTHGQSMMLYTTQAGFLLVTGLVLCAGLAHRDKREQTATADAGAAPAVSS